MGLLLSDYVVLKLPQFGIRPPYHVKSNGRLRIRNFFLGDQIVNVSEEGCSLDCVDFRGLNLDYYVKFGRRLRLPVTIKALLARRALIATESNIESQELPHIV